MKSNKPQRLGFSSVGESWRGCNCNLIRRRGRAKWSFWGVVGGGGGSGGLWDHPIRVTVKALQRCNNFFVSDSIPLRSYQKWAFRYASKYNAPSDWASATSGWSLARGRGDENELSQLIHQAVLACVLARGMVDEAFYKIKVLATAWLTEFLILQTMSTLSQFSHRKNDFHFISLNDLSTET